MVILWILLELIHSLFLVWADNADAISTQYSGTGALKTDFTRTGKRTRKGALQDGLNSMVRYVKNNFLDGSRQVILLFSPIQFHESDCH